MNISFVNSLQSEWLKKKRSLAVWMVVIGAFFIPLIIITARMVYADKAPALYASESFWMTLWSNSWESVAIFLLPMGTILATSLITQLEFKNNTWKQLHTMPLSLTTIFFSKLTIILAMLVQFFILFNAGIYLSAMIPYWVLPGVSYPGGEIPVKFVLKENLLFLIDVLPIVGLQFLLSMHFRNFLVSLGAGILLWVFALGSLSWKFGYSVPYSYPMYNFLKNAVKSRAAIPPVSIHAMAIGYFVFFIAIGYFLYLNKKERG